MSDRKIAVANSARISLCVTRYSKRLAHEGCSKNGVQHRRNLACARYHSLSMHSNPFDSDAAGNIVALRFNVERLYLPVIWLINSGFLHREGGYVAASLGDES